MSVGSGGVANFVYTTNAVAKGVAAVINAGTGVVANIFDPRWELFSSGEQGLWYDLNDDSTIFQDSAGTTLATWGDPVGRVNDKSGNGNNAVQSTSGARMIRGRMPKRGAVNLVVSSEDVSATAWTKTEAVATSTINIRETTASSTHAITQAPSVVTSGLAYTNSCSLKKGALASAPDVIQILLSSGRFGATQYATVNVLTGEVVNTAGAITCTSYADPINAGAWIFVYTCTATSSGAGGPVLAFCDNNPSAARVPTYAGSVTADVTINWSQFEQNSVATAYQRVGATAFDITESGQPSCGYLSFNGSNQWMQTAAAVNFSATDEMSVFAGVLKRAAAGAFGAVFEHTTTTTNNGSFNIFAPGGLAGSTDNYSFVTRGTTGSTGFDAVTFAPPHYAVLSSVMDNGAATRALQVLPRVNGAIPTLNAGGAAATGAGNYANAVTYFGARGGTSLFFNGLMFSIIIRGALTSGEPLTGAEKYVASCTPTVTL